MQTETAKEKDRIMALVGWKMKLCLCNKLDNKNWYLICWHRIPSCFACSLISCTLKYEGRKMNWRRQTNLCRSWSIVVHVCFIGLKWDWESLVRNEGSLSLVPVLSFLSSSLPVFLRPCITITNYKSCRAVILLVLHLFTSTPLSRFCQPCEKMLHSFRRRLEFFSLNPPLSLTFSWLRLWRFSFFS